MLQSPEAASQRDAPESRGSEMLQRQRVSLSLTAPPPPLSLSLSLYLSLSLCLSVSLLQRLIECMSSQFSWCLSISHGSASSSLSLSVSSVFYSAGQGKTRDRTESDRTEKDRKTKVSVRSRSQKDRTEQYRSGPRVGQIAGPNGPSAGLIYMLKGNRYTTVRAKRERGKMSKTIEAYPPSPRRAHTHTKLEEALEIQSLRRIISAYLNYSDAAEEDVKRCERSFRKLPHAHKALLSNFPSKCRNLRRCISENSFFILNILEAFEPPLDMSQDVDICECDHIEHSSKDSLSGERRFCTEHSSPAIGSTRDSEADQISCEGQNEFTCPSLIGGTTTEEVTMVPETVPGSLVGSSEYIKESESPDRNDVKIVQTHTTASSISDSNGNVSPLRLNCLDPTFQLHVPLVDVDKVRCIIRNIVRDWAPEGLTERDQCYKPILEELDHLFPSRDEGRRPCCLVPGAGLGRLALEISTLGFISQGNEFSYYMMICSSFILNHTQSVGEWTIYPWIHSNCNSLSDNDQLRAVSFPDIHPASAGITEGFSMCGGDFVEVYNDPTQLGAWDAVVTCFFLDTAHNVVEYIEIISKILKDGGVWINLGPLLYHFADAYGTEDEMSIELSLEDLRSVAFHYGFHIQQEKTIETTYTANPRSMMQTRYNAAFWTMIKKGDH